MFVSETKNLLFNDNTECLARLQGKNTYEEYLGSAYVTAVANLRQCSSSRKWNAAEKPPGGRGGEVGGPGGVLGMKKGIKVKAMGYPAALGSHSVTVEMQDREK